MSENKTFWQKLKGWIDGDEIFIDADEYISTREIKERVPVKEDFHGTSPFQFHTVSYPVRCSNDCLYRGDADGSYGPAYVRGSQQCNQ